MDNNSLASVLALLQGGGGGQGGPDIGAPTSGLQWTPSLSGQWTLSNISGNGDPSISGGMQGGTLGAKQGGPSLAELNLNAAESATGPDTSGVNLGSILQGIAGTIGQQQVGQFGGQGFQTAGNTSGGTQGGYTAGQTAGTGVDPLSVLSKVLGLGKSISGIGASPTQGDSLPLGLTQSDISGSTPEAQAAFAQQRAGERTASPYVAPSVDLSGSGNVTVQPPPSLPGYSTEDIIRENLPPGGEGVANTAGVGAPIGAGTSQSQNNSLSGQTNIGGALQGGLGSGIGLLNLLQGVQSGNVPGSIGGGLQSIGGLAQLIKNSPALAQSLAGELNITTDQLGSLLGGVGGSVGVLGGGLGLATGIQGLLNGTSSPLQSATQLGGGLVSGYGGLASLVNSFAPNTLTTLSDLIGSGISSLSGTALGNALGIGATEAGAGAGAEAGAAGAGAAGAGGTAIAAAPLAAIVLANTISGMLDSQHAAYGAGENFRKLTGDLPQAIQSLRGLPAAFNQLPQQGGTPDQAQAELSGIQNIIGPWLNSGLYDFTQSGQTSAGGGWSGQDATIKFPQGPGIFNNIFSPAFNAAEQQAIRGYDTLGQAGQTFAGQPDPASIVGLNFSPYNLGLQEIQRLNPNFQLVPSPEAIAQAGPTPWQTPPPGFSFYGGRFVPTDVMGDLLGLQNGGLMSGIENIVSKERSGGYAPLASPNSLAAANAASQYNPAAAPTFEQMLAQYATPYQDLGGPQA